MSSDKLDNKISEAAEHHHPSYDEKAWQNMEKLLDEHLPQEKKKRRRFFFILFSFLLLGSGVLGYYIINKRNANKEISNPITANSVENNKKEAVGFKKIESNNQNINEAPVIQKDNAKSLLSELDNFKKENKENHINSTTTNKVKAKSSVLDSRSKKDLKDVKAEKQQFLPNEKLKSNMNTKNESGTNEIISTSGDDSKTTNVTEDLEIKTQRKIENNSEVEEQVIKNENQKIENSKKDQELIASKEMKKTDQNSEEISIQEKKEKYKAQKSNSFFFSLSTGPDLSFVASNKLGSIKILGGFGVGYTIKNGLTFRTGFYSGRKVYSASPDAYNPPAGFAQYYPILENVDADCKIYEIPISISYSFANTQKQNWFVSAGISSLIMKEEKYNYTYKYVANGPSYKKDWTINNENKHLFSVLTLSGGYQRQLSKKVSLMMEPYFKIPLQGVGYGKVKLNNAGVLFTLTVNPFRSKEKK